MNKFFMFALGLTSLSLVTSCSDSDGLKQNPEAASVASIENSTSPVDDLLVRYRKEDSLKKVNEQISHSKEIPVGNENFNALVSFIEKRGFVITGLPSNTPMGHQYTFYDSKGNRHALIADRYGDPHSIGTVSKIVVYGYRDGIKDQDHFFPYTITPDKVYCDMLQIDGTWPDADRVKLGYEEFLKKAKAKK